MRTIDVTKPVWRVCGFRTEGDQADNCRTILFLNANHESEAVTAGGALGLLVVLGVEYIPPDRIKEWEERT